MKRIAFIICFAPLWSLSQNKKDTSALEPVEVRATRVSATAPFAKTNISKKEIDLQNLGQDLPFLLNQTPSTVINSDAGNGVGYTGIRIRGTDATRINVTLNGIPYNDAESQGTFFVDLPDFASSVNSIQIQRGVGTSTNGAGAFGASINLSTTEENRNAYVQLNNSIGSFNTLRNTVKAGTGLIHQHFTTDVRFSRISSDGYIDRASSQLRSFFVSTAYVSEKTDIRLNVFSGNEKTYQAWYGVSENDLQANRHINYAGTEKPGTPYHNETDNYRQDHYQLHVTRRWRPDLTSTTALFFSNGLGYYEQYKAGQNYARYGLTYPVIGADTIFKTDLIRRLWLDNHYYGTVFSLLYNAHKMKLTGGGSITHYDGNHNGKIVWMEKSLASNKKYYNLNAYKTDFNVYTKWQQQLSTAVQVFAEMQVHAIHYDLNGFRDNPDLLISKKYHFFNPKLGFSYHIKNWLAYASMSKAAKEPNRDDFEAGRSQQPSPEKLNDLEAGIENKNNQFHWAINVYYMHYRDQLILTGKINDVGAYTRSNIPVSYRLGTELQAGILLNSWLSADVNLTLSRNKIKDFTEYLDDYDNGGQKTISYLTTDISFSPEVISAASINILPLSNFRVSAIGKYVSKQYLDNTSNNKRKLGAFFTQDLRAVYSLSRGHMKDLELIFQVNNISNLKYEPNGYTFSYYYNNQLTTENFYFPMAGRNWMAGVNIKL